MMSKLMSVVFGLTLSTSVLAMPQPFGKMVLELSKKEQYQKLFKKYETAALGGWSLRSVELKETRRAGDAEYCRKQGGKSRSGTIVEVSLKATKAARVQTTKYESVLFATDEDAKDLKRCNPNL
jgi:hypothetical protein